MAIISPERFKNEDIYLDYDFEDVMFRYDHKTQNIYRKFYGEQEHPEPIHFSNRLYCDTRLYGDEITKEQYNEGKRKVTAHTSQLARAIQIASKAHENQVDKANKPYILHPLRLMMKFENINEQIVAVLHDVIEDSDTTLSDLRNAGLGEEVINAIDALTKKLGLEYQSYLEIISKNELAKAVKIEDIKDNLNLTRLQNVSDKDLERAKKYHQALQFLESH